MSKIIGSLENWDSLIDFYRPNGSSKTWYMKELNELKYPLMWGKWNVYKEDGKMFDKHTFMNLVCPFVLNEVVNFREMKDIGDSYHLYIISVYTQSFFIDNFDIGFSCISTKYLNDVRIGKSKIVILLLYEGFSGMKGNNDLETMDMWMKKENLPPNSVYFISGNLIGDKIAKQKKLDIKVLPIQLFDIWNWDVNNKDNNVVDFKPSNEKYLYLSYNRQPSFHRVFLACELYKNNLLDKGVISLSKPKYRLDNFFSRQINDYIMNNTPFIINPKYNLKNNLAVNIEVDDYKKTFISIITETLSEEYTLFISEKTWKPIIVGHPFIIYGSKDTLKYLKSLGYKTFDKWIDESYDNEPDRNRRGKLIVKEINKLNNYTLDELKEIRKDMYDVCLFNKNLFIEQIKKNWHNGSNRELNNHLLNIWNELINGENKPIYRRLI